MTSRLFVHSTCFNLGMPHEVHLCSFPTTCDREKRAVSIGVLSMEKLYLPSDFLASFHAHICLPFWELCFSKRTARWMQKDTEPLE